MSIKAEKHGMYGTPEYRAWRAMKYRCHVETAKNYAMYGGRGICVIDRWFNSFSAFFEDMGLRPSNNHSLDRINNSLGYNIENCRWADKTQQTNNRDKTLLFTLNGETHPLGDWARILEVNYETLFDRAVRRGWTVERAFTQQVKKKGTLYDHAGESLSLYKWAKRSGLNYTTLRKRVITNGITLDVAMSLPLRKGGANSKT